MNDKDFIFLSDFNLILIFLFNTIMVRTLVNSNEYTCISSLEILQHKCNGAQNLTKYELQEPLFAWSHPEGNHQNNMNYPMNMLPNTLPELNLVRW